MRIILAKVYCIFVLLSGVNLAPLVDKEERNAIINIDDRILNPDGQYAFRFSTSNKISRFEQGQIKTTNDNKPYLHVTGFYAYDDQNGVLNLVQYEADDKGYREAVEPSLQLYDSVLITDATLASLIGGGLG